VAAPTTSLPEQIGGEPPLEHEGLRLAGREVEGGADAAADALEAARRAHRARDRALERQRQHGRAEDHAVRVHLDLVSPRTWTTRRISRWRCMPGSTDSIGMKSCTSPPHARRRSA
jgi:hypothetical protein